MRSEDGGQTFSYVALPNIPGSGVPSLAATDDGEHVYVVTGHGELHLLSSSDRGDNWTDLGLVDINQATPSYYGKVEVDSFGSVYLAWVEQGEPGETLGRMAFAESHDGGNTRSFTPRMNDLPEAYYGPALGVDSLGNVALVWREGNPASIYADSRSIFESDRDGDGCVDGRELGDDPMLGGGRDLTNPSDYFNPTHDGKNRIDDILAVLQQYFIDQGNAGYTQDTDRTLVGPNAWNLGPPNGLQRVDDVLNIIHHYYHDCA